MYSWIFRKVLPGPTWLKVLQSIAIVAATIYVCFEYVYPWAQVYFRLAESTV